MIQVREYFNSEGFSRWNKIYSDTEDVNFVQKFIREGHQQTIDKVKCKHYIFRCTFPTATDTSDPFHCSGQVLKWIDEDGSAARGETFCDAGCGVGSLAIPLAIKGAIVQASDISAAMATEAQRRADSIQLRGSASFSTADLESLEGARVLSPPLLPCTSPSTPLDGARRVRNATRRRPRSAAPARSGLRAVPPAGRARNVDAAWVRGVGRGASSVTEDEGADAGREWVGHGGCARARTQERAGLEIPGGGGGGGGGAPHASLACLRRSRVRVARASASLARLRRARVCAARARTGSYDTATCVATVNIQLL